MESFIQKIILLLLLWASAFGPLILMNSKLKQGKPLEGSLDRLSPYVAMVGLTIISLFAAFSNSISSKGVTLVSAPETRVSDTPSLQFDSAMAEQRWTDVPIITHLRKKGLDLSYIGDEAGGLHAFYGTDGADSHTVYYITPDGKHAVAGLAVDADGKVITTHQLEKISGQLVQAAESTQASDIGNDPKSLWNDLEQANWISLGDPDKIPIYMIADPACPHCAQAWAELEDAVQAQDIHVRVIPVSLINGSDPSIVHGIFNAPNPAEAWVAAIGAKRQGRRAERLEGRPSPALQNMLMTNHQLFQKWELTQVPQFVFLEEEEDGVTLRKHAGLLEASAIGAALR